MKLHIYNLYKRQGKEGREGKKESKLQKSKLDQKESRFEGEIMAAVGVETKRPETVVSEEMCSAKGASKQGEGLRQYYVQHIHELQLQVRQKSHNLNRLEAQRNELNSRGFYAHPNP